MWERWKGCNFKNVLFSSFSTCHSERSEESAQVRSECFRHLSEQIPHFVRNDSLIENILSLFVAILMRLTWKGWSATGNSLGIFKNQADPDSIFCAMHHLFALAQGEAFAEKIGRLHDGQLAEIFGRTILNRAYDYLEAIESVYLQPRQAEAKIYGSEPYEVVLEHRAGDVFGDCSCPYESRCKHLAALLMHLRDHEDESDLAQINAPSSDAQPLSKGKTALFDFDKYLENLSADELRASVRQFAPESYRRALAAQQAEPNAHEKALQSAEKRLRELFKKAGEYGPDDFESTLLKHLNAVRPFWLSHSASVTALLRECIEGIDAAQGEGYLYDDYSDGVFEGDDLGHYLAEFVAAQPAEAVLATLQSLLEAFDACEYSNSTNFLPNLVELLSETKRRAIAPFFLSTDALTDLEDRHQRVVWQHLQPLLTPAEQGRFLERLVSNSFFALELATLLESEGKAKEAISMLEKTLETVAPNPWFFRSVSSAATGKSKLFERRIELEERHRKGRDLGQLAARYVQESATAESLHFVLKYLPAQQDALEKLLQKTNVEGFARYLEDLKRLDEVVALFRLKQGAPSFQWQYDFFKRHKKTYPEAAKVAFQKVLDEALPHPASQHYRAVTEALTHLKVIEPAADFQVRINVIRLNYKRRSSLMAMLREARL
jgi:hypothetical protein